MNTAQQDIFLVQSWLRYSTGGGDTGAHKGAAYAPYAHLLPVDPDVATYPDFAGLADGGLVFFASTDVLPHPDIAYLERPPTGLPPMIETKSKPFATNTRRFCYDARTIGHIRYRGLGPHILTYAP